ncbi:MAG: FIST C-terminal domain-containing protein [Gammaproteobacteria bacterium]|nr:FIST C-terminal domain-containing protein [Gammaproteobacteria bacterium]
MHWTSNLSHQTDTAEAIGEVTTAARATLGAPPDLVFLFASEHHQGAFDSLPRRVREGLGGEPVLVGCSASGVIADALEVEFKPALGLVAARLPGAVLDAWHLEAGDLGPGTPHSERCTRLALEAGPARAQFVVLADPFSFPAEHLLHSLESGFADAVIAGGLASGGQAPGDIVLFLNADTFHSGALVLSMAGDVEMTTAVAQGCRPIGEPMFITAHEGHIIHRLDNRPPLEILNEVFEQADEQDRELMQHSLFIGITMRSNHTRYRQGDFLIRNLMGADQESGAIRVGADLHANQVVQFHLRDAGTSAEDLDRVLARARDQLGGSAPAGALLFSCTGRGEGLYGIPDHDADAFQHRLGPTALGGFFCNGEIGPVQGKTYLHGYTSAFALFRPRGGD